MAIKLKHSDTYSTYFITFTCVEWISLFEISNTYDMVYNWFAILKEQHNADVVAYVPMPIGTKPSACNCTFSQGRFQPQYQERTTAQSV